MNRNNIYKVLHKLTGNEKNAGLVLIFCTIFSLVLANSFAGKNYSQIWHAQISIISLSFTVEQIINDGLMAVFFLMVGLDIKKELTGGELYPFKKALLPLFGAIGGMLVPALIYIAVNFNTATRHGFGIPMGTDIAFALGILSLAGNRVPLPVKIILTAIAIIDDLGSILVIALFYGSTIHTLFLFGAVIVCIALLVLNRFKVGSLFPYLGLGGVLWFFMLRSGIHPTISGVLLAMAIPLHAKQGTFPATKLQGQLYIPVTFIILPLFTLANTAIPIKTEFVAGLCSPHVIGIGLGLLLGKPLGIILSFFILTRLKLVSLPQQVTWRQLLALGFTAGIGFTMSIFITQLAFSTDVLIQSSRLMILIASCVAGSIGFLLFYPVKKVPQ